MKTAVIGLGNMGTVHAEIVKEQGNNLVAVCDIDEAKLEKYTDAAHYSDYIEMLDNVKPDVVHICTPHYLHAEMIIASLERGVNVLCEKPLCIHEEDIPRILEAEEKSSAILAVCHQNRYNAANLFVKDWLADKKIYSATANVVWSRDKDYYDSGEWRGKWATEGGGVLINQALHTLDLVQWFCGMPTEAVGNVSNNTHPYIEVEDTAAVLYKGAAEFSFFATTSSAADFPVEITVSTDGGIVSAYPDYAVVNGEMRTFDKDDRVYGKACYGDGHTRLIRDFYEHAARGEKMELCGAEAAKVVKLILAAYRTNGKLIEI